MMERLFRALASAKLAAVLILVLMSLSFLNVLVPQRTYFSAADFEAFRSQSPAVARVLGAAGLDALFGGWLIAALALLLVANVTVCTVQRMSRRRSGREIPVRAERMELGEAWGGETAAFLHSARSLVLGDDWHEERGDDAFVLTRYGSGFWGSVVLHASIVVIAAGGALTSLTSFAGTMVLSERLNVTDERGSYLTVENEPELGGSFTGARLRLERMSVAYERGIVVRAEALMSALDERGRSVERAVTVNHPLDFLGKSYLLQDTGLVADIDVSIGDQQRPLILAMADRTARGFEDELSVPTTSGAEIPLILTLTPVPLGAAEPAPAEMLAAADPRLEVREASSAGAGPLLGVLRRGGSLRLAPGTNITFGGVRYWSRFLVRSAPARIIVYAGFILALAGSAWRFALADRRLGVSVVTAGDRRVVVVSYAARPWGFAYARDRSIARSILAEASEGGRG